MMPAFDQLYVISDLHLGGKPGFQIFNQGSRLAAFIRRLAEPSDRSVGLVLNGDIVDFLAEDPPRYLDPLGAVAKLERIYHKDPSFTMIWQALEEFISLPNRVLVLVLGNHDVELALPPVREWLIEHLSRGNAGARGQITLAFDGAGYACTVGDKRVLCLHGNEVDTWNIVDFRALLRVARSLNRRTAVEDWDANAGTRMVIDVMNEVKRSFPIVDLLKPEVEAVAPVILALDPGQLDNIIGLMRVASYLSRDKVRRGMGFLSAQEEAQNAKVLPSKTEVARRFLAEHYGGALEHRDGTVEELLARAYEAIQAGDDPKQSPTQLDAELLGVGDWVRRWFGAKGTKEQVLRHALRKLLRKDQSFNPAHEDATFKELDKEISGDVHYMIAGHTHLEKAIERLAPGRYYFNSGTWIRLIRLPDEILDDEKQFAQVYQAFAAGSMEALDGLVDLGPEGTYRLIQNNSTVVSIEHQNGHTYGELSHARDDGSLDPVPNTRLPRS